MTNANLRNVDRSARRAALWFEWVRGPVGHLRVESDCGKANGGESFREALADTVLISVSFCELQR